MLFYKAKRILNLKLENKKKIWKNSNCMQFGKVCISINQKNISPALGSYLVEQLRFERYANCNNSGPAPPYDHWVPTSKAVRFPCCTVPIDDKECKCCVRLLSVIL